MPNDRQLSPEQLQGLYLELKYQAAIRRLARGITHSYNNIFTGLSGQLTLLLQESASSPEPGVRRGELIDGLLERGIEKTAFLFEFARDADAGLHSHPPLLIATRALDILNSISRDHQFVLHRKIDQGKILCNLRELMLVLFYIGENCVDVMPEGGEIDLTVELKRERTAPRVVFSFHDRGPGFAKDILDAPFAPVLAANASGFHHGLGLYAAKTLAQKNFGSLTIARSEPGRTEVEAAFPLAKEEQLKQKEGHFQGHGRQNDGLSRQCILIVEDDEALRTFFVDRLQRRGHMVFCVASCAEALEEYEQLHDIITVILMDVGLPDTSGFACLREMQKIWPQTKIIFMSGHKEAAPTELAGKVFLEKPFSLHQLEQAIRKLHD